LKSIQNPFCTDNLIVRDFSSAILTYSPYRETVAYRAGVPGRCCAGLAQHLNVWYFAGRIRGKELAWILEGPRAGETVVLRRGQRGIAMFILHGPRP
jgi:hypothetical protein